MQALMNSSERELRETQAIFLASSNGLYKRRHAQQLSRGDIEGTR